MPCQISLGVSSETTLFSPAIRALTRMALLANFVNLVVSPSQGNVKVAWHLDGCR